MKNFILKHRKLSGGLGAIVAFTIATIYFFIVPEESARANAVVKVVLLYGHSICWILLGSASVIWALNAKKEWTVRLAYAALGVYLLFIGALMFVKFDL